MEPWGSPFIWCGSAKTLNIKRNLELRSSKFLNFPFPFPFMTSARRRPPDYICVPHVRSEGVEVVINLLKGKHEPAFTGSPDLSIMHVSPIQLCVSILWASRGKAAGCVNIDRVFLPGTYRPGPVIYFKIMRSHRLVQGGGGYAGPGVGTVAEGVGLITCPREK